MATRISRNFSVLHGDNQLSFNDKASVVVDGMGTRIYNHDGSVAFSSPSTSVTIFETSSKEVTIPDPVVPGNGEPTE
ncbi:hypothetical protein [Rhizobium phage RHph_X3_2]|nr:hypothetical protein [Rhizobium phage RHph_X3_2]